MFQQKLFFTQISYHRVIFVKPFRSRFYLIAKEFPIKFTYDTLAFHHSFKDISFSRNFLPNTQQVLLIWIEKTTPYKTLIYPQVHVVTTPILWLLSLKVKTKVRFIRRFIF